MSQTILIEPREDLKKLFKINLSTHAETDVVIRDGAEDAIELLSILPTINLIICKSEINGKEVAKEINRFLKDNKMETPLLVLGDASDFSSDVLDIDETPEWSEVVKYARILLGLPEIDFDETTAIDYKAIEIHYFLNFKSPPCDVFLQNKTDPLNYQYEMLFESNQPISKEIINKHIAEGITNLHIPKEYEKYFVTFVTNNIIKRLETNIPIEARLHSNSNAYEIVKAHLHELGVAPEINELAESNIQSMVKSVQETPELSNLLKSLLKSQISYAYQKAHLLCIIGNFILSKQKWYEKKHLEVFTYLAFFADITLKSSKQMKISSMQELSASDLSQEEKEAVLHHALNASQILKNIPQANAQLETIIKEHHGVSTGIGFREDYSDSLHPLSRIFMISDAFVRSILSPDAKKSKIDILNELYKKYSEAQFKPIIKALEGKIE